MQIYLIRDEEKHAAVASGTIENLKEVKCALAEWPPRASNGTLASIEIPMEMKHTR